MHIGFLLPDLEIVVNTLLAVCIYMYTSVYCTFLNCTNECHCVEEEEKEQEEQEQEEQCSYCCSQ